MRKWEGEKGKKVREWEGGKVRMWKSEREWESGRDRRSIVVKSKIAAIT